MKLDGVNPNGGARIVLFEGNPFHPGLTDWQIAAVNNSAISAFQQNTSMRFAMPGTGHGYVDLHKLGS